MNLVEAEIAERPRAIRRASTCRPRRVAGLEAYEGGNVILGIRPSDFEDASLGRDPRPADDRGRRST